jgi:hypothetical protein
LKRLIHFVAPSRRANVQFVLRRFDVSLRAL